MRIRGMEGASRFPFLVALEIDSSRTPATAETGNEILGQADSEQMLAHLAADLTAILGGFGKCHLASAGVLLDQCQILRPEFPVFAALAGAVNGRREQEITSGLRALGARRGVMPLDQLQPDESIPPAPLRFVPVLASGPADLVQHLSEEMEHRFLAEGQLSAHTASWFEAAFGIGIAHARFMTLTDLNAMFRLQLEHFGYLPLWELVDAAIERRAEPLTVTTESATNYEWRDGSVRVTFQTFDFWANHGGGRDVHDPQQLPSGYAQWSRDLRRFISTLAAHHVSLEFELPPASEGTVGEDYLCERAPAARESGPLASITEHNWPELGTLVITACAAGGLKHFYPLAPQGLNHIHEVLQTLELEGEGMAFPGTIKLDESERRLRPARFEA